MIVARRVSRLSRRGSFWAIAFAFLSLTALSTAPSPLYRLYADHDRFSSFTVTVLLGQRFLDSLPDSRCKQAVAAAPPRALQGRILVPSILEAS